MPQQSHSHGAHERFATHDDALRVIGDVGEFKLLQILALRPTLAELDAVGMLIEGKARMSGKRHRRPAGISSSILSILAGVEDD